MKCAPLKERYPPRWAAVLVVWGFDWESRKADYRSFLEEYIERLEHSGKWTANSWLYFSVARTVWETFPPGVREALIGLLIKLILRG